MVVAYKVHIQFILLLVLMYVIGVWVEPVIYALFPIVVLLFGIKRKYFELLISTIWILILSDYVPVSNATYMDLQFAKDLKPIMPIALFVFMILDRDRFKPFPKFIFYFIPFFCVAIFALQFSLNLKIGVQKTLSFILMYATIPAYVAMLFREMREFFWMSLFTYIMGMLAIGVVLGFAIPEIGILENTTRFKGIFGNPNGLGIFLNLTFILWIVLEEFKLITLTKRERWFTFFVIAISLLWCGSRNGIMSITLFYLVYRAVKVNWFLAVICVLAFVAFSSVIFDGFIQVVGFFGLEEYFRVDSLEAGSGRTLAWLFAWTEIQNYYFIGGGFGHDEHVMRPNYYWLKMEGHDGGVHNSYLSMWFDAGIIGVILYYGTFIRIILKSFKAHPMVLAFGVSIFFNITYESWLVASLNPFTIMFLMIVTIFFEGLRGESYSVISEQISENHTVKLENAG